MKFALYEFNPERDWAWIRSHAQVIGCEDTCGVVMIDTDSGQHVAAAVFDSFTHSSALAHIVITNKMVLRHNFLEEAFGYAFLHRHREVLYGLVPADNTKALKFDKHIGFSEKVRLKDGFAVGTDYVLLEMTKDSCCWLGYFVPDLKAVGE